MHRILYQECSIDHKTINTNSVDLPAYLRRYFQLTKLKYFEILNFDDSQMVTVFHFSNGKSISNYSFQFVWDFSNLSYYSIVLLLIIDKIINSTNRVVLNHVKMQSIIDNLSKLTHINVKNRESMTKWHYNGANANFINNKNDSNNNNLGEYFAATQAIWNALFELCIQLLTDKNGKNKQYGYVNMLKHLCHDLKKYEEPSNSLLTNFIKNEVNQCYQDSQYFVAKLKESQWNFDQSRIWKNIIVQDYKFGYYFLDTRQDIVDNIHLFINPNTNKKEKSTSSHKTGKTKSCTIM